MTPVVELPVPIEEGKRLLQLAEDEALQQGAERAGVGTGAEGGVILAPERRRTAGVHEMQLGRPDLLASAGGRPGAETMNDAQARENVEIGRDRLATRADQAAEAG